MDIKTIDLKKTILEDNDADADRLRQQLRDDNICYLNIMSSPGAGKTTMLVRTITDLQKLMEAEGKTLRMGVMEADIDSDVDARTIMDRAGVPSVQLHTGGMCHLDAEMSRQGLAAIGAKDLDLVFLENVGNLVCPAEFDTGAVKNIVLLSIPEGDDKPLKYPLMFREADAVLVTKIDAMPAFDFDRDRFCENLKGCCPDAPVFFISAAAGDGMEDWCRWLADETTAYLQEGTL